MTTRCRFDDYVGGRCALDEGHKGAHRAAPRTYPMKRRDGAVVRVTVPRSDDSTTHRLEAFDMMRDALRALIETDLHDAGNLHRARLALEAADRAAEIE